MFGGNNNGSLLTREKCERIRVEEGEKQMTKRIEVTRAPAPLEEYIQHFDPVFGKSNQREGFRQYLEGLLLPSERHKTLTGLVNTEPVVGAQLPRAQKLHWFLSEADGDERKIQAKRLRLLREDATTAANAHGGLVIDETGDRKDGHKTAPVGRRAGVLPTGDRALHSRELFCQRQERSRLSHQAQNRLAARPSGNPGRMSFPCGGS